MNYALLYINEKCVFYLQHSFIKMSSFMMKYDDVNHPAEQFLHML